MKYTHVEKISARNALDRQIRILGVTEAAWQEEWDAAANPFTAWEQWKTDTHIRTAAYAPWLSAKKVADLRSSSNKNI